MATITNLTGQQFLPNSPEYPLWQWQYATSTFAASHDMRPGLIVQPADKTDIKRVIAYAKAHGTAISIRSGGHHYSGASSTGPANIQLDLRSTFQGPEDLVYVEKGGSSFVRASVSHSVGEFNEFLGEHHAFVPHGQCRQVFLGGHVQTGGYGQLIRAFGLLGDHIRALEIIDCDGRERTITQRSDPEMFFAWLGGSPGNLGVLTHVLMEVYRDADYNGSIGIRAVHRYDAEKLRTLLGYLAEMSDDENFPRNYDLCIGVLSSPGGIDDGLDVYMREEHPEIFGEDGFPAWPRSMIMIYAQYVPFSPEDKPDMDFFERLRTGCFMSTPLEETPMSELTTQWIFQNRREFDLPYAKRTYSTRSTTLATNGWVGWVVERIDEIARVSPENGQWVSAQVQCLGGKQSMFRRNAENGTSFSWRDTTMAMTIDNFHKPEKRAEAEAWQARNDRQALGPDGIFSKHDRRLLWGAYGSFDLDAVWPTYYENRRKYERLMRARSKADPHGTFTPNAFCVKRAEVSVLSAL
ncbi:hypothetical protein FB45DRAFT_836351 [Roridomyces roridus]|uniref:FAD-binding PCMH-type domain-containing protein n=1 Tax=Roridomyces roridus TaxID=1738132 RepID=A0AAD7BNL7_9AGAR|nr:hypothetical protein FB45DRAFT_836351 [Roridomyces roridus]